MCARVCAIITTDICACVHNKTTFALFVSIASNAAALSVHNTKKKQNLIQIILLTKGTRRVIQEIYEMHTHTLRINVYTRTHTQTHAMWLGTFLATAKFASMRMQQTDQGQTKSAIRVAGRLPRGLLERTKVG